MVKIMINVALQRPKNGKNVYLRDVARVEDSIEERAQETFNNGTKGGMIVSFKLSIVFKIYLAYHGITRFFYTSNMPVKLHLTLC